MSKPSISNFCVHAAGWSKSNKSLDSIALLACNYRISSQLFNATNQMLISLLVFLQTRFYEIIFFFIYHKFLSGKKLPKKIYHAERAGRGKTFFWSGGGGCGQIPCHFEVTKCLFAADDRHTQLWPWATIIFQSNVLVDFL